MQSPRVHSKKDLDLMQILDSTLHLSHSLLCRFLRFIFIKH
ncbi:hypothetical protein HFN_1354 [Helicobacter fennelliae MRY12-0050]|uniref:Uncharacterized protein n=1 Tax=Helicobacter fennelliae MRY12-0050 TaxID=1325130 RepID=T1D1L5_9HELI|nr:hypothetical protein HFN_1354 [Helicobacter fennelliae MRY12-0050]